MSDLLLPKDDEIGEYKGWVFGVRARLKPELFDSAPPGMPGVPSCWIGNMIAIRPAKGKPGINYLKQPLWLTRGQMEKCVTSLDKESATAYMMDMGLRCIKISIDRYERGEQEPTTLVEPPAEPDGAKPRVHVGPEGLKIDPPT